MGCCSITSAASVVVLTHSTWNLSRTLRTLVADVLYFFRGNKDEQERRTPARSASTARRESSVLRPDGLQRSQHEPQPPSGCGSLLETKAFTSPFKRRRQPKMSKLFKNCHRRRFATLEQAKAAAYSMSVRQQKFVQVEPCGKCNGYHLRAK